MKSNVNRRFFSGERKALSPNMTSVIKMRQTYSLIFCGLRVNRFASPQVFNAFQKLIFQEITGNVVLFAAVKLV